MNSLHCCQGKSRANNDVRQESTRLRRPSGAVRWMVPGALLALMPKCPVCIAAYVSVCTGLTMPYPSAQILRRTLIALCIGTLALLAARCVVNCFRNKQQFNLQLTHTHQ